MNQKVALRVFELNKIIAEEQSDEFNEYEDLIEGISEMSDNAGGSSDWNDNSSVSEKTCMRLEIARLQHEVECMKTSRGETLASDEMRADLTEYLQ
ncbi:uncharacterized protein BDCG_17329 [Blastomyces dermatitidis ER-3]|uniref:Uncharacterized protein n=1 Tax=Ajellomyces dermatitidis (strain ER-3 / ATCC MYA-2586) TaxID=559297 RepID=A0ABX2VXX6_AJEDR|nr:uncharacterized protein BDCG_17329 [Blastomyces dermatitidis ER-3]OAT01987.1 hypothetical protein BDCG_17329 [Blastomyces dermatitidis ER-3]